MVRDLILFLMVLVTVTIIAVLGGCVTEGGELAAPETAESAAPNPLNCILINEGNDGFEHRWGFCNDSLRTFVCNDVTCLPLKVGH